MVRLAGLGAFVLLLPLFPMQRSAARPSVPDGPSYTADGQLRFPEHYRSWVYLTSGFNMSYQANNSGDGMFDNVFVNSEAYRSYQQTGHWPEGTELVLESRGAEAGKSINKIGKTQTLEVMGLEVHLLDSAHAASLDPKQKGDGWSFYSFDNKVSAKRIERPAACYTCHEEHAAVDTTFVQFYPTLLDAAERNKSFNAAYLKETQAQ